MTDSGRRRGDPAAEEGQQDEHFSFVDENDPTDVIDWLKFTETRTERREERRRRFRTRMIALAVVGGILAGIGGFFAIRKLTAPDHDEATGRATVLFQVRNGKGGVVGSTLLVHDRGAGTGGSLVVPATLDVEAPGHEPVPFKQALAELGPSLTRDTLADMLGVGIDGSWTLEDVAFENLVDQLGGVDLTFDAGLVQGGKTVLPAGPHRVKGSVALAYATYRKTGEPQAAQQARFQETLRGLLAQLPVTVPDVVKILDGLGIIPDPAFPNERLAATLAALARDADARRVRLEKLPLRNGGVLDVGAAAPLVKSLLGGSVKAVKSTGPPRVLLEDGSGTKGAVARQLRDRAAARLLGGGFRYVNGGVAEQTAAKTSVQVPEGEAAKSTGVEVALTLGLSQNVVQQVKGDLGADVVVVLGADFPK